MLFEAGSVKAGGGENWIPLCLPGFNNRGYLYMYVSFLSALECDDAARRTPLNRPVAPVERMKIAILLISADKESFYELKQMRDDIVAQLEKNGSVQIIKTAVRVGRPNISDIVPGTQLRHFLFKSRPNVQIHDAFTLCALQQCSGTAKVCQRFMSSLYTTRSAE